jgi:hypothetical protein
LPIQINRGSIIYAMHGVAADSSPDLFVHRNLLDTNRFVAHLLQRERPYVPLAACLKGEGDALTIDDSIHAAAQAAHLARKHGHAVTLFLNGYNIERSEPYFFSRLNAALDATKVERALFNGITHDLRSGAAKQRFRSSVKQRFSLLGSDIERQNVVDEINDLLGTSESILPSFLRPITRRELTELVADGVDIQNHGWTHVQVGALPPDQHAADIRRGRDWLRSACGSEADLFAVPNGDGLPLWEVSPNYSAWFLLDDVHPLGECMPGLYNRLTLNL